jgi:hypothetical protein
VDANDPRFKKHSFLWPCQNARLGVVALHYAARTSYGDSHAQVPDPKKGKGAHNHEKRN